MQHSQKIFEDHLHEEVRMHDIELIFTYENMISYIHILH